MSTHVVGIKPPTPGYLAKLKVWEACETAGVPIPDEVLEYFNHEEPDPSGMVTEITGAMRDWSRVGAEGHEVIVGDLPEGVEIVRFYNSW